MLHMVLEAMPPHINGFGLFVLYTDYGKTFGGVVVNL